MTNFVNMNLNTVLATVINVALVGVVIAGMGASLASTLA